MTDVDYAPWHIVKSADKRRARLNCISTMLCFSASRLSRTRV
ncbi:MAG: hypothetical protein ACLP19_23070 [Xanthobacteraceae bacterium]